MAFQNGDPAIYANDVPTQDKYKAASEVAMALHIAGLIDRISEGLRAPPDTVDGDEMAAKIARLEMAQRTAQRYADAGFRRVAKAFPSTLDPGNIDLATSDPVTVKEQFAWLSEKLPIKTAGETYALHRSDGSLVEDIFRGATPKSPLHKYIKIDEKEDEITIAYSIKHKPDIDAISMIYLIKIEKEFSKDFVKVARMPFVAFDVNASFTGPQSQESVVDFAIGRGSFEGQLLVKHEDGSVHLVPWAAPTLVGQLCGLPRSAEHGQGTAPFQMIVDYLGRDEILQDALRNAADATGPDVRNEVDRLIEDPIAAACSPTP